MLRHYDKLGLLIPEHIDGWTGYRYYTIQQLPRLHRIIALKDMGLSLQQIGDLLQEDDSLPTAQLRGMLALKRSQLAQEKQEMERRLAQVEARLLQLDQGDAPTHYEIAVKAIPSLPVASLHQRVPHIKEMDYYCQTLSRSLYRHLQAMDIMWTAPELVLYHATEYRETDLDVEVCVTLPEPLARTTSEDDALTFRVLPPHILVASLIFEGSFTELAAAALALLRWVGVQQHVSAGPLREIHLSGPAHPAEPVADLPIIELQLPMTGLHS